MLKWEFQKEKFKFKHDHPEDFTTCFWQKKQNVLPIWIVYRLILALYYLGVFPTIIFFKRQPNFIWYKQLLYAPSWTIFIQLVVFWIAFIITVERFVKEKKNPELPPKESMPWHYKTLWILYNITASNTMVVTIGFWCFVYDPEIHTNLFYEIESRTLNCFLMIFDILLSAIPIRFLHFYLPISFVLFYCSFTCVYQSSGGTGIGGVIPIYDMVDWRTPVKAASTALLCVLFTFIAHSGLFGLHLAKLWMKKPKYEEEEEIE